MRRAVASAPLLLVLLTAAQGGPQQPPTFGREVELVRVDVVVTDKSGQPVRGLSREDFTLLDEGKPQEIVSFEAVELPAAGKAAPAAARPRVATNLAAGPADTARTYVVILDDLNLTMQSVGRAKAAVAAFLDSAVREGDRVTVIATGGGIWWSARMLAGRTDVLAILKGLQGRRIRTDARDAITDYEAMRIYVFNDSQVEQRVRQRFDTYGVTSHAESEQARENREIYQPGVADPYVNGRATETYLKARTRNRVSLAALERGIRSLGSGRDRKTVLLASDGFVYDTQEPGFLRVVEAARRANAAIHFLDTRGLQAPGIYSAQFDAMPADSSSVGAVLADSSLDAEGSEAIALDTGGYAIRNTNDLTDRVQKVAQESQTFYLLGFTPAGRDGRFHKLEIKLRGKNATLRARKGYYAGTLDAFTQAKPTGVDPVLQETLDAAAFRPAIPLRMTAYVLAGSTPGKAQALVACEVDVSHLVYEDKAGQLQGSLEVLLVVAQRETGEFSRFDQRLDLVRKPGSTASGPKWYPLVREFDLAPGGHQAKIVVRDPRSQQVGSVAFDFEVPPLDQLRVSTPVLTDAVQEGPEGLGPVVVAHRTFAASRPLYCRFDVYGAATGADRQPVVKAGYALRRDDGTVVSRSEPTAIQPTSLGALARMLVLPLSVSPGNYELLLDVRDEIARKSVEAVEPFTVE